MRGLSVTYKTMDEVRTDVEVTQDGEVVETETAAPAETETTDTPAVETTDAVDGGTAE